MIDLNSSLTYLPSQRITELEIITQRIVDTGKAEIVLLFGSYARGDYKETCEEGGGRKSDYDILIVTADFDQRNELRAELLSAFQDIKISVQLIIEAIAFVNNRLEDMQYFFTDVKREGKVLFNSGRHEFADAKSITPQRRLELAQEDFKMWFQRANEFYVGHSDSLKRSFQRKAAFELQQAVEMCYTAIEMVFTHYNPHEHNLSSLRDRIMVFDKRIKTILPEDTHKQRILFDTLNFAYIGGRYRTEDEFPITQEQLDYWQKEIEKLLKLTEAICQERIDCLIGVVSSK